METTVEQKLKALYELQKIDSKIDSIRTMRGELPMEVKDLEDEIEGLQTRLSKFAEELLSLKHSIQERKTFIKEANAAKAKYETQLMTVKNSREYDALSKEIEISGLDIQLAEKKIKDYTFQQEERQNSVGDIQAELDGRQRDLVAKKAELDSIVAETEKEENELLLHSNKASEKIDNFYLAAYRRIRKNARNGLAVVSVERGSCGGCFNAIPPQKQMDIRTRKKVIPCEHCGRILVDAEIESK